jgi:DnaJ family protein C protein 1
MTFILFNALQEVLIFLTFLTSLLQYTVQRMTYKNDLRRIETIIKDAKLAAWGPKMIPIDGKRKVGSFSDVK